MLDTSIVSALMREESRAINWVSAVGAGDHLAICSIVRGEIRFGISRLPVGRRKSDLEAKAEALFAALDCQPVSPDAADHYAKLKLTQQSKGFSLDENDLWIAATAFATGATLVSNDLDFQRIDALPLVIP